MKQSEAFQKKNKNKDPECPTCPTTRDNAPDARMSDAGRYLLLTGDPHHPFSSIRSLLREGSSLMLCRQNSAPRPSII